MDKSKRFRKQILRIIMTVNSHHTGAYAAQAAYFFVLSLIPILLLLVFMAVRYTPLNQDDVLNAVLQVFPTSVSDLMRGIVYQVYRQSESVIPVTIIVALWAAGRGVLSVTSGLNAIYSNIETRNYFYLRIRSTVYTLLFLIAIILSLVISVFGNSISAIVYEHIPFLSRVVDFIMRIRTLVTLVILTVFWDMVYRFLPNRRHKAKTTFRKHSFVFSIYLDIFTGFSDMYGSMTTLILILLWLYGCMYIILLGGEINALLDRYVWRAKSGVDKQETCDKMEE